MKYRELAHRLHNLASTLEKSADQLGSPQLATASTKFEKALNAFEKVFSEAAQGLGQGMAELKGLLGSPDKKLLTLPALKLLYRDVLNQPAPSAKTAAPLIKLFFAAVARAEAGEKALQAVRELLLKSKASKAPIPKDVEQLRLELNRLGRLDDETLAFELDARYSKITDLKNLLKANGVAFEKDLKKDGLKRLVIERARRIGGHIL